MRHGTFYSSTRKRCKCGECKAFWNGYMRDYRKRLRERAEIDSSGDNGASGSVRGNIPSGAS